MFPACLEPNLTDCPESVTAPFNTNFSLRAFAVLFLEHHRPGSSLDGLTVIADKIQARKLCLDWFMSDPDREVPTAAAVPPRLLTEPLGPSRRPCTCWRARVTSLSLSREKWSLTRSVLAPNPPGAVLKRHRSDVDRNTFIGIVSPFKRRLRGGVALAATGRRGWLAGWLAGYLISLSPALDSRTPGWRFRRSLALWVENRSVLLFFFIIILYPHKAISFTFWLINLQAAASPSLPCS